MIFPTVTVQMEAGESQRFAPNAFTENVGRLIEVSSEGGYAGLVRVIHAEVSEDGRVATLTLQSPGVAWQEN